jgi:hypothetical protein
MTNSLTIVAKESKCLCLGHQGRSNWTYNSYQACTVTQTTCVMGPLKRQKWHGVNEIDRSREEGEMIESAQCINVLQEAAV